MAKTYIVIVAIAAVILGVSFALPDRHFVDSVFPLHDGASIFEYDDKADGGASDVTFALTDSSASFSCMLGADTTKSAWCGLLLDLSQGEKAQYRNWTFVPCEPSSPRTSRPATTKAPWRRNSPHTP